MTISMRGSTGPRPPAREPHTASAASRPPHPRNGDPAEPELLGRDGEIDLLRTLLTAPAGESALVLFPGDPGIGKTRLLTELGAVAGGLGLPVLGLSNARPAPVPPEPAGRRGLLLVDDAHALAGPGIERLAGLLSDPVPGLVVAVGYRPRQRTARLAAALEGAAVPGRLRPLRPLNRAETARLTRGRSAAVADRVFELSGGNPGYVVALLRTRRPGATPPGWPEPAPGRRERADEAPLGEPLLAAPPGLEAELAALSEDERELLAAAAILADPVDPGLMAELTGRGPEHCAAVVDRLVGQDILRSGACSHPTLLFRHPVVKAVCYQRIPPGERWLLHSRAVGVLRHRDASPVELAWHLTRAAVADSAAVDELARAARLVGARSPESAARWLRAALRICGEGATRLELTIELARAELAVGRPSASRELLQWAGAQDPGPRDVMRLAYIRALADRAVGRPGEAVALLDRTIAGSPALDGPLAVRMAAEAAVSAVLSGSAEGVRHARLAADLRARSGDCASRVWVPVVRAFTAAYAGNIPAALPGLREATAAVDALTDEECARDMDVLATLAWTETLLERDLDALRHFARGLEIATSTGLAPVTPYLLMGRCHALGRQGRLEEAVSSTVAARAAARALGIPVLAAFATALQASVVNAQQGPAAARPLAEEAVRALSPEQRDWPARVVRRIALRLRFESGDPAGTEAALSRACGTGLSEVEACTSPYWATVLMDMALAEGDDQRARRWADTAGQLAARTGLEGERAHATHARARLLRRLGQARQAADEAGRAANVYAVLGWPTDEASARLLRAQALDEVRDWRAAESELAIVRRLAESTGSALLLRAAVAHQRRTGARAGRLAGPKAPDAFGLTRREWEIARMVVGGASNADIAGALYVTVKTVESHLTKIFRKVGARSRNSLIAVLGAGGSLGPAQ
jgi:DNA-binding NarL/FixJ family response regulator